MFRNLRLLMLNLLCLCRGERMEKWLHFCRVTSAVTLESGLQHNTARCSNSIDQRLLHNFGAPN